MLIDELFLLFAPFLDEVLPDILRSDNAEDCCAAKANVWPRRGTLGNTPVPSMFASVMSPFVVLFDDDEEVSAGLLLLLLFDAVIMDADKFVGNLRRGEVLFFLTGDEDDVVGE